MRPIPLLLALACGEKTDPAGSTGGSDTAATADDTAADDTGGEPAPTPYGPENRWYHADAAEVPVDLVGTGTAEGDIAPNFTLLDQDGNEVELYQFYGQVVQLVIFTAWCGPCQEEAPDIEAAAVDLADEGVVILSVMMEDVGGEAPDTADLMLWVDRYALTQPVLAGPGELDPYINGGYPTLPVIGRDMTIVKGDNFPFSPAYLSTLAGG
jgi:thiol-disulfide isomerase/thioredoxin